MPPPRYLLSGTTSLLFSPIWEHGHGEAPIPGGLVLYIPALAERISCAVLQCVLSRVIQDLLLKIITLISSRRTFFLSLYFGHGCATCGILVLYQPGIAPRSPTVDAQSPNHLSTRRDPLFSLCCKPHYSTFLMMGPCATSLYFFSFLLNYS